MMLAWLEARLKSIQKGWFRLFERARISWSMLFSYEGCLVGSEIRRA